MVEDCIKPQIEIAKINGNIYAVLAAASKAMKDNGVIADIILTMKAKVQRSTTYKNALDIIQEYVEFV